VEAIDPNYGVAGPPVPSPARARKVAVFVAHGMGQQIPYQTLDQLAESLRKLDEAEGHHNAKPASRALKFEDQWLQRVELQLKTGAAAIEAHVYEAYWAPLTEGRITTRNVVGFLAGAGMNGLSNGRGKFKRWLFNRYADFPIPIRTVLLLFTALATVAALMAMNSTIALVAAARALLAQRPQWLSDGLFADLTTTFNVVVTTFAACALFLFVAHAMRGSAVPRWIRQVWSWLTLTVFSATIFVVILSGLSLVLLFFGHVRAMPGRGPIWYEFVRQPTLDAFNRTFDDWSWIIALSIAAALALSWAGRIMIGFARDIASAPGRKVTALIALAFVLLSGAIGWVIASFIGILGGPTAGETVASARRALAWPLLVVASAYIRLILVQYLGDVAIYVMPYKLDAFNDLRKEIKERVYKVARAVYEQKRQPEGLHEYERIVVVGHSLGSVIAYDALNRLILEDESAAGSIDVVGRTPLFLTFGSPLDKTAFIFAVQGQGTSEARESVVASMQPLIQDYRFRPKRWINVFSPWDIISGSLDFYDLSEATDSRRVTNEEDAEATTLLIAHTEYWTGNLVMRRIYEAL
jgi:hypothetical protein